jgi:inhibitor of KinA
MGGQITAFAHSGRHTLAFCRYLSAMGLPAPDIISLTEQGWLIRFHTGTDPLANQRVHTLAAVFAHLPDLPFLERIPAYDSLYLKVDTSTLQRLGHQPIRRQIASTVQQWLQQEEGLPVAATAPAHLLEVPVCYDPCLGNDLTSMAAQTGLSPETIVQIHTAGTYQVYLLGFLPGFAYMGTVDPRIAVDRKVQPVPVKAGAVGIAGLQTGIYPANSPGGWHILGFTPLRLFDPSQQAPTLFSPGMQVRFHAIDYAEYKTRLQP